MSQVARPYITGGSFWELLESRVALTPDRLVLCDEAGTELTYREFRDRSERVAAGLAAMGVIAGSRVSWQLPTKIDTIVLSMALSRLGVVQNPIIHLYRDHEVRSLLEATTADLFVVQGTWRGFDYADFAHRLAAGLASPCGVLVVDDGLPDGDPATLPPVTAPGGEVRWIYATSGTTSVPKAVLHTDESLIAGGEGLGRAYAPGDGDVSSVFFPYAHIGGPDQLVITLEYGLTLVLMEAFVLADAVRLTRQRAITFSGGSTAHYQAFAGAAVAAGAAPGEFMPSLKFLCGGGAPKPPEVYWKALGALGVPCYHGFGMTESPSIASCGADDDDEQRANTDGLPVVGAEVEVRDDERRPLPAGVEGELWVRGPMVCKGYLDPAATAAAFDDAGFFHTGDRGLIRGDGRVVLTGRSKDMIIRKGENVSPREIEDVLATHPKVGAVAVIGLPDEERGELVCAVVELAPGAEPLTMAEVQDLCRSAGLMRQKHPERLEIVDALPRNPTLKILKTELRARLAPG